MNSFAVTLTSIGTEKYQIFIKNKSSDSDFIRIIIGSTYLKSGKRVAETSNSWIISPLQVDSEKVFIKEVSKQTLYGKRLWIAFEAVERAKPKNITRHRFVALSPPTNKWRERVGSSTYFDIKAIDSPQSLELVMATNLLA